MKDYLVMKIITTKLRISTFNDSQSETKGQTNRPTDTFIHSHTHDVAIMYLHRNLQNGMKTSAMSQYKRNIQPVACEILPHYECAKIQVAFFIRFPNLYSSKFFHIRVYTEARCA